MPFNGNGVFSIVNTFTPGTTISSPAMNGNFSDIATGLSDCLTRDGQAPMTAALKLISGSSSVPGVTFAAEPTLGFYRSSSGIVGLAGSLDASGGISINGVALLPTPIGVIFPYAGAISVPSRYLFCYGQALSRTTYSALFAAVGIQYGAGDGSTTFNIPDLRGRVAPGRDDMGGSAASRLTTTYYGTDPTTLGAPGGAQSHTLITAEIPAHSHANSLTDPGHTHPISPAAAPAGGTFASGTSTGIINAGNISATQSATTGITINNVNAGGGTAHANVQPSLILNYIIYAGV